MPRYVIGAFAIALTAGHAHLWAGITPYSTRSAFNTAAGPLGIEDFESFTPTENAFLGTYFDFGAFYAMNESNSTAAGGDIRWPGTVNGSVEIVGSIFIGGAQFHMIFDQPITALGFDADNLADQRFDDIIFNNTAGDIVQVHDAIDEVRFWGFISDTPFTSITIRQTGGLNQDGFRFDDIAYSIPSPAGVPMLVSALLVRLRRHRA